jgi:hypothetical protein
MAFSVAKEQLLHKIRHDTPPAIAKQIRQQAEAKALVDVFGEGFRRDKNNKPMEQGIGTPDNMTSSAVDSYEKWGKNDPNYNEHLAELKRQLAVCQERRRKEREAAGIVEE